MGLKNEVAKAGLPCLRDYTQISFPFVCQAETNNFFPKQTNKQTPNGDRLSPVELSMKT